MPTKIIVNVTPFEIRSAVFEGPMLTDVHLERVRDRGIVGNIYKGQVQRVLPGMQASFIEMGLAKAGYLYAGDIVYEEEESEVEVAPSDTRIKAVAESLNSPNPQTLDIPLSKLKELNTTTNFDIQDSRSPDLTTEGEAVSTERRPRRKIPKINTLIKSGEPIVVQVAKDAIGTKGPRVTGHISLPGRYLVYMPTRKHIGISRRIDDESERERLKSWLEEMVPEGHGVVARTIATTVSREALESDLAYLVAHWGNLSKKLDEAPMRTLVQQELDLTLRMARDVLSDEVKEFWIDDEVAYQQVVDFVQLRDPTLVDRVKYYDDDAPMFARFNVESELERAMNRKVWLKSGGSLVIDHAEALTAIDVNTGKYVGKRDLEDTIFKTNLEAVEEIAYQLRLRNIGGMVILDFIDMEVEEHQKQVVAALERALERDRAKCKLVRISELGLVEMTRRRTKESLNQRLSETCWYCEGKGVLKSKRTLAYEIFRYILRQGESLKENNIVVHANPEVVDVICQDEGRILEYLEERVRKNIVVRPRGSFHQEQYDIFGHDIAE